MSKVLKIALQGYNAVTDTDPDHFSLYVDQETDYILIKEKIADTISVTGTVNVAHGLQSGVPFCMVFVETSTGVWRKIFSTPIDSSGYWFEVNGTNLIIYNTIGVAKNFAYHIFYDNLSGDGEDEIDTSGKILAIAKIGKNAFSHNPNDFIFHSKLNTFKIIKEATKTVTLSASTNNQSFTEAHLQKFIPLPSAFAKQSGIDQIFLPNADNIDLFGVKLGWTSTGIRFNYVSCDDTNIIFNFDNTNGTTKEVSIRYFLQKR